MRLRFWKSEQRSIDKRALWGAGLPTDAQSWPALPVSRETATRVVAVYACVRLRAETCAGLPADVFRRRRGERVEVDPSPQWLRRPNPEQSWFEFVERVNTSLDLDGNAYVLVTARDALNFPAEIWTLHPDMVEPQREQGTGRLFYLWGGQERLAPWNERTSAGDLLHIRNVAWGQDKAPSPIGQARHALGLFMAAEKHGSTFFSRGTQLSGVITLPDAPQGKTVDFVRQMRELWMAEHSGPENANKPGVLTGGATWQPISVNAHDAQFLETRKFQVAEIARLFGIPPHMIGDVERSTSWGSGIEQQQIGFVQYSINPRLSRLEAAFNQLLPRGQFLKWNVNGLLRGDSKSRAEFYSKGIQNGWFLRSEARQLEDLPKVPDLDEPLMPTNLKVVGEEPEPAPVPAVLATGGEDETTD